jgi:hypothetical protein
LNVTETETSPFDWGPLGEAWWLETAEQLGASALQTKFACAKHRGCSNTEAARQAGYKADGDGIRSAGYRAMRSNLVERLLAFAAGEDGGYGGEVDRDEAKRILSSLARGSDPRVRISAVEQINKMDAQERAELAVKEPGDCRPVLQELVALSPSIAAAVIAETNAPVGSQAHNDMLKSVPPEVMSKAAQHQEEIARNWIRDHAAEAKACADFWLTNGIQPKLLTNGNGAIT